MYYSRKWHRHTWKKSECSYQESNLEVCCYARPDQDVQSTLSKQPNGPESWLWFQVSFCLLLLLYIHSVHLRMAWETQTSYGWCLLKWYIKMFLVFEFMKWKLGVSRLDTTIFVYTLLETLNGMANRENDKIITSPSSSRTRRNTPWAAGCWGPKFIVIVVTIFSWAGTTGTENHMSRLFQLLSFIACLRKICTYHPHPTWLTLHQDTGQSQSLLTGHLATSAV